MEKQFVTYEIALKLKELGFNEKCFAYYNEKIFFSLHSNPRAFYTTNKYVEKWCTTIWSSKSSRKNACQVPLWQQVVKWIREKHHLDIIIRSHTIGYGFLIYHRYPPKNTSDNGVLFMTYEEAQVAAVLKALELVK